MYEADFDRIVKASKNNSLTFFVGAGVSSLSGAPSWKDLINSILRNMGRETKGEYSSDEYLRIPQMFYYSINQDEEAYYSFVNENLFATELMPNIIHKELLSLNPISFITTNFDDLLEDAAVEYCQSYKSIACDTDVPDINGDRFILKVHGDMKHRNIVFKEEDYLNYSENFKLIETLLKSIFSTNTVVFWGYSLNDYNIKLILNWAKALLKDNFNKPIFVYTGSKSLVAEEVTYHESKGLRVIEYERICGKSKDYIPRYLSVINAIKKSADLSFEGKTEQEAFDVLYKLLEPLDKLRALRLSDITDKLSTNIRIGRNGVILYDTQKHDCFKKFFEINDLQRIEYESLPEQIKNKYRIIMRVLAKAQILYVEKDLKCYCFAERKVPFGDPVCIEFDFKKMYSYTQKKSKSLNESYRKAFYLSRLKKYDEAYFLFAEISKAAFKEKNYLLYYLSEVNRISILKIIKNVNAYYRCYDMVKINSIAPSEDIELLFTKLPVEFQNQYRSLKDLYSENLLYKYSYNAFVDGQKLQNNIEKNSIEYGLTSGDKVICRINDYIHFLLSNNLVVDEFSEYKNSVKNLMSLLVYKYSTQKKERIQEPLFPDFENNQVAFDELDFYCFIDCFTDKEIIDTFKKYNIETISFQNIDQIEKTVKNILAYYDSCQKRALNIIENESLVKQIKSCLALLRYVDISQELVDRVCSFILKYEFRDILISDKVLFLYYQLERRKKYSDVTAKEIENKLIFYLDSHIKAIETGKSFNLLSTGSINYCDLVHYIAPSNTNYRSHRLSLRISKILDNDISLLYPNIAEHYWAYISAYQRRRAVKKIKDYLSKEFKFNVFLLLINCNVKLDETTIELLKNYLRESIIKCKATHEEAKVVSYPIKDPYEELNQIGYWCLIKALPYCFDEFIGESDKFDFYYMYNEFDFNIFQPSWLLNLYPHTLNVIAKNKKVKDNIRLAISDTVIRGNLAKTDKAKLQDILVKYFC